MNQFIYYALLAPAIALILVQGRKNLDTDFGIKNLKLESHYNLYKDNLQYVFIDKRGVEYYEYKNPNFGEVFGFTPEKVFVVFYQEKLYSISIYFGILTKNDNLKLLKILEGRYDIPEISYLNNTDRVWAAEWETGKTLLQATEYSCSSRIEPCVTEVFILSKSMKSLIPN